MTGVGELGASLRTTHASRSGVIDEIGGLFVPVEDGAIGCSRGLGCSHMDETAESGSNRDGLHDDEVGG